VFGRLADECDADDMTARGISSEDWRRVRELTAEIVTLSGEERYEASEQATHELLDVLADLQRKYGPMPSLLAIRADHTYSLEERESLLLAAYHEAKHRADLQNQTWLSHSLAAHYLDAVGNDMAGERWLVVAEHSLLQFDAELVAEELARLRGMLDARRRPRLRLGRRGRRTNSRASAAVPE
jgi:hypothetical protein